MVPNDGLKSFNKILFSNKNLYFLSISGPEKKVNVLVDSSALQLLYVIMDYLILN